MDDTVILNSQLVLEDNLLRSILETDGECVVSVDIYKNWMTNQYLLTEMLVFCSWTRTSNGFDSSVKFVSDGWDLQI